MKWCVEFPEETLLVVRPSLDAICLDIKPAAKLLSELLYRCSIRKEHQQDAQNMNDLASDQGQKATQDTTLRIYRTQAQLVQNMIHEMTEKTLHKVAVPALLLLGYIDLEEYLSMNCYIIHVDRVRAALLAYRQGDRQLDEYIRSHIQLENFPIDMQLENFPIDRKKFLLQLEKVLIAIRKSSNLKRGRKPRSEAGGEPQSEEPQIILKIDSKIVIEEEGEGATSAEDRNAPINLEVKREEKRETKPRIPIALSVSHSQRLSETSEEDTSLAETQQRIPIVKPSQHSPGAGTRSLAATPPGDGQDDSTSGQASLTLALGETPVQRSGLASPPGLPPRPDAAQGGKSPPMAMTARDIKKQNEKHAKELWTIIEDELHTTFTENQRKAHKDGIASLIADDLSDEAIRTGLQALNTFERRTFTVQKFYGWLPNLSAKVPVKTKTKTKTKTSANMKRPTLDEVECIDPTWCVYQRPGDDLEWILWQGELCTPEEADERGYAGGGGLYIQTQYA